MRPYIAYMMHMSAIDYVHTHMLALLSFENKDRLPASGLRALHPESHVDADSCTRSLLHGILRVTHIFST